MHEKGEGREQERLTAITARTQYRNHQYPRGIHEPVSSRKSNERTAPPTGNREQREIVEVEHVD